MPIGCVGLIAFLQSRQQPAESFETQAFWVIHQFVSAHDLLPKLVANSSVFMT